MKDKIRIDMSEYNQLKEKADKLDALQKKVDKFYETDEEGNLIDEESHLGTLGEITAIVFGYLPVNQEFINDQQQPEQSLEQVILDRYNHGNIVYNTIDGTVEARLSDFLAQSVDSMLYDLNLSEDVILTFIDDPKWVNDYAACKVIRALHEQNAFIKMKMEEYKHAVDRLASDLEGQYIGALARQSLDYLKALNQQDNPINL